MDPELLAKLSRRLRSIEGATAEVQRYHPYAIKEEVTVASRPKAAFLQQTSSGGNRAEGRKRSVGDGRRRRVRVPSWVVDTDADPKQFMPPTSPKSAHGHRASAPACSGGGAAGRAEDLLRRVRGAEMERDALQQEVTKANQATHREDLQAELVRLRSLSCALRQQLETARHEIETHVSRGQAAPPGLPSRDTGASTRAELLSETRSLAEMLHSEAVERRRLQLRFDSLCAELEHQAAGHRRLQEELEVSHRNKEDLQRELEVLEDLQFTEEAELAAHLVGDGSALEEVPQRRPPRPDGERRAPELPPLELQFALAEDEPDRPGQEGDRKDSQDLDDLEFAYDWGLGLSTRMSVDRALELARWAGRVSGNSAMDEAIASEESSFEAPLAELQDALAVLQQVSTEQRGVDDEVLGTFDEPIACLQEALDRLKDEDAGNQHTFDAPLADLKPAVGMLDKAEESKDQDAGDQHTFDAPLADLMQAISVLGMAEESKDEDAGDQHAFDEPLADLKQAIGMLSKAEESVEPPAKAEDLNDLDAFASRVEDLQKVLGLIEPPERPPDMSAETIGAGHTLAAPPGTVASALAPGPGFLASPFSTLNSAQALIRQKYAAGGLTS